MKDDVPLRVALGVALGSCVNFFPSLGFGFPLAVAIAFISRTSIAASLVGETVCKPLFPLFYYLNLCIGNLFFSLPAPAWDMYVIKPMATDLAFWSVYARAFMYGAFVNMLILGSVLSGVFYLLLKKYRCRLIQWLTTREEEIG